jgi:hypothetical protein
MNGENFPDAEEFRAQRVHFYAQSLLADYPGLAGSLEVRAIESATIEGLVYTMRAWCLAGQVPGNTSHETVRWPKGWWQAWKDQYAPDWLKRRFPVRYAEKEIEKTVNVYFVCPHVHVPGYGDGMRQHLKFMATGSPQAGRL